MGKTKTNAATTPVPQNRTEAEAAVAEIGRLQRELQVIQAAMNEELSGIKGRHEGTATPLADRIQVLTNGLETWAAANRAVLTHGGKTKTVMLATGEIRWRVTPPRVVVRGVSAVLDALRRAGMTRFLRQPEEEIDKEAILADPAAVASIAGLRIEQREEFVVVPFAVELEAGQ
ncbi:MAG: host-nuclease inhibitor Gam family protein [Nitrospirota bacterium]|nr:host-nuclease inhibitor Gam family protein [Nitrospirota bacterium]